MKIKKNPLYWNKKNFAYSKIFVPNKKNFLSGNFCVAEPKGLRHVSEPTRKTQRVFGPNESEALIREPQPHAQSALKADSGQKVELSDSGKKICLAIFAILLFLTISISAFWGESGMERLSADLRWRGTFISAIYLLVVPEVVGFYNNMENLILANPELENPEISGIIGIIIKILEAVYVLSLVLCGFYLILLSGSVKGRARVKYLIPRLMLSMVLVVFSTHILRSIFNISSTITKGILAQNPVKTETIFLDTFNGLIGIFASRTSIAIESGHPFLLSAFLFTLGIFTILSIRFILLTIFAIAFPIAISLYFFDTTKDIGRRLLEQTVIWTIAQEIIAVIVLASNVGILFLNLGGDLKILSGVIAAFLLIISPFIIMPMRRFMP